MACTDRCKYADPNSKCTCSCGGRNHGIYHYKSEHETDKQTEEYMPKDIIDRLVEWFT